MRKVGDAVTITFTVGEYLYLKNGLACLLANQPKMPRKVQQEIRGLILKVGLEGHQ